MKKMMTNSALLLLSTILGVVAVEILILFFLPQQQIMTSAPAPFFIRFDERLGWANREGAEGPYRFAPDSDPVRVRINEAGFRGRPAKNEKAEGVTRLLVLGDSNAFGYGIEEDKRFSDRLESRLPENYEVLNLGVYGYGSDQELILFESKGLDYHPDVVVLAFSAGDSSDNMNSINSGSSKPYFKLSNKGLVLNNSPVQKRTIFRRHDSRSSIVKNFLYSHSNLYRLVFNRLAASSIFMPYSVQEMSREEGMETTVRIITKMDDLCRKNECRLVVMLISHEQLIAASVQAGREIGYFPELKMLLSGLGVRYIDTSESIALNYKGGERLFLNKDPVHLNARGNELVAETLYKSLLRMGYILQR